MACGQEAAQLEYGEEIRRVDVAEHVVRHLSVPRARAFATEVKLELGALSVGLVYNGLEDYLPETNLDRVELVEAKAIKAQLEQDIQQYKADRSELDELRDCSEFDQLKAPLRQLEQQFQQHKVYCETLQGHGDEQCEDTTTTDEADREVLERKKTQLETKKRSAVAKKAAKAKNLQAKAVQLLQEEASSGISDNGTGDTYGDGLVQQEEPDSLLTEASDKEQADVCERAGELFDMKDGEELLKEEVYGKHAYDMLMRDLSAQVEQNADFD